MDEQLILDFNKGMSYDDLCKKYHHKFKTIKKILKENNVSLDERNKVEYLTNKSLERIVGKETIEKIIKDYLSGKSKNYLSTTYNYSPRQISQILKKSGIELRPVSNKKYFLDDNFFDVLTPEGAYIIGFLAADGWIKNKDNMIELSLQEQDSEILEKIKNCLKLNRPIRHYIDSRGREQAALTFSSFKIKKQLAQYGVVPSKTFKIQHLPKMHKDLIKHYIRGYADGDGSIHINANGKSGYWSIGSANENFLKEIMTYLEEQFNIPQVKIYQDKRADKYTKSYYSFFYNNANALKLIYEALYMSTNICMERKYNKFTTLYNEIKRHEASVPQNDGTKDMLNSQETVRSIE